MAVGRCRLVCCWLLMASLCFGARAAEVDWRSELRFYGDNTEFRGPYREGETILGAQVWTLIEVKPGPRTTILAGAFGDFRSVEHAGLTEVDPILSFRYRSGHNRFILGTLHTVDRHGLIDPLQVSTLELTRPVEQGLQFLHAGERFEADVFLNWQKLNTEEHREVFDVGVVGSAEIGAGLDFLAQLHAIHHGGQLYNSGPIYNNVAYGPGLQWSGAIPFTGATTARVFYLESETTRLREQPDRPTKGSGTFASLSATPWPRIDLFASIWKGDSFYAAEGDPNYGSLTDSGEFVNDRDYREIGARYTVPVERGLRFTTELRFHWIDDRSTDAPIRLFARVPFSLRIGEVMVGE